MVEWLGFAHRRHDQRARSRRWSAIKPAAAVAVLAARSHARDRQRIHQRPAMAICSSRPRIRAFSLSIRTVRSSIRSPTKRRPPLAFSPVGAPERRSIWPIFALTVSRRRCALSARAARRIVSARRRWRSASRSRDAQRIRACSRPGHSMAAAGQTDHLLGGRSVRHRSAHFQPGYGAAPARARRQRTRL